jgi:hypothetical protein
MGQVTPPEVPAFMGSTLDIAMIEEKSISTACHVDQFSE